MSNVKISVVIPMYNTENYISNTLKSLSDQTTRNFEIVLVDDGSTDNSVEVATEILKNIDIPYTLIQKTNGGQGSARNAGVENSAGEWVLFLDSDDTLQAFALELYEKIINSQNDVEAIFSDCQSVTEDNIFNPADRNENFDILNHKDIVDIFLKRSRNLLVPGTLYKKSYLLSNNIMHRRIRWSEDQCFQWEVLNKINKVVYLNCILYNYLRREGSVMHATKTEVMISAYDVFKLISGNMVDDYLKKYLLPRWVLGCLHVAAKRKDKDAWTELWNNMNGSECMRALSTFPDLKIRVLAVVGLISKNLLFRLMR